MLSNTMVSYYEICDNFRALGHFTSCLNELIKLLQLKCLTNLWIVAPWGSADKNTYNREPETDMDL